MKRIKLTQGKWALVDNKDYNLVSKYKWYAHFDGWNWYALTNIPTNNKKHRQKQLKMHRLIMNITDPSIKIDHRNSRDIYNGLNNRRKNLRITDNHGNSFNRRPHFNSKSKYKGITPCSQKWQAAITKNGKNFYLGCYKTERKAALAYNRKAREFFGEYAYLNCVK